MPVGREPAGAARPSEPPPAPGSQAAPGPPADDAAMAAELQRFLLEAPAEEVVAQHAMGLYELAVLHLSQPEPRLSDARLAIDALAALLDGLEGRLGEVGRRLREVLPQLQMAYVQLADRSSSAGDDG